MQQYGLDPGGFINAARPKEEIKAYVELHIEQGPVLEKRSIDIGVVEGIVGLLTSEFNFSGQANHAGTTPVSLRQDALRAASETITKCFTQLEEDLNGDARLTFGKLDVSPGASNVVPSLSRGLQEIRAASYSDLDRIYNQTLEIANDTAHTHEVTFESKILSRDEPAKMAEPITSIISSVVIQTGRIYTTLPGVWVTGPGPRAARGSRGPGGLRRVREQGSALPRSHRSFFSTNFTETYFLKFSRLMNINNRNLFMENYKHSKFMKICHKRRRRFFWFLIFLHDFVMSQNEF